MPRVAASNGIRPEYRALAVIQLNKPVTPKEINDHVGTGDYAAKYISFLRRDGFVFDCTKDGRRILSYTLVTEPANAASFRNMQVAAKVAKPAKTKAAKKVKQPAVDLEAAKQGKLRAAAKSVVKAKKPVDANVTAINKDLLKEVAARMAKKSKSPVDEVAKTFGTSGEVGSSFAIDSGFDSTEGLDLGSLVR